MYQIDHTKSTSDNILALVNGIADLQVKAGSFDHENPVVVAPTAGNDQSNTRLHLVPSDGSQIVGETDILYTRLALATNRPSVGDIVFVTNEDTTHADVHAKIFERQQLVAEEIAVTDALRPPLPEETRLYTLNPIANSPIYVPGSLVIKVRNRDDFAPVDPALFFGASVGDRLGRPVYVVPPRDIVTILTAGFTEKQTVCKLFSLRANSEPYTSRNTNLLLTNLTAGSQAGQTGNTFVDFEPGPNSPLASGGTFFYTRQTLQGVFSGAPEEVRSAAFEDCAALFAAWRGIPLDNVTFGACDAAFGARRIFFSVTESPNCYTAIPVAAGPSTYLIIE